MSGDEDKVKAAADAVMEPVRALNEWMRAMGAAAKEAGDRMTTFGEILKEAPLEPQPERCDRCTMHMVTAANGAYLNSFTIYCDLAPGHDGPHSADWGSLNGPTEWEEDPDGGKDQ